jgi:vacuolar iron transporter family protein
MASPAEHTEHHFFHRIGWLRAAVLGANDGIVSTASLIVGVAAASPDRDAILVAGVAGLVAGAMSMAAGEYVSVSSQSDTEKEDIKLESAALDADRDAEHDELAALYVARGVDHDLARDVATQLMDHDDLAAHAQDELGITETATARPLQAAVTSAAAFSAGAILPLAAAALGPPAHAVPLVSASSLLALAILGAISARAGGAPIVRAVIRVVLLGGIAMAVTAGIGALIGTAV